MLKSMPINDYCDALHSKFPLLERFQTNTLKATVDYYAECLANNAKAVQCVERLFNLATEQAQSLSIGFSDRSLGNQLPAKQVKHGLEIRLKLEELEIYKDNGRETLRGYVTIPLLDEQHHVTGIHALQLDAKHYNDEPIVIGTGSLPQALFHQPTALAAVVTPDTTAQSATPEVVTPVATPSFELIVAPHQVTFIRGDRHYKVQGLDRNMSSLGLRVSLQASRQDLVHLDTLDLVKARSRSSFIRAAASELYLEEDILKKDIGLLLLQLEDLRNRQIEASKSQESTTPTLSESEQESTRSWCRTRSRWGTSPRGR